MSKDIKPCEKLQNWNWKNGDFFTDNTTSIMFKRNYFDCGIYYFDGIFNVVRFPKGMSVYHGSGILANSVVEFPVGINFYKPYDMSSNNNLEIKPDPTTLEFLNIAATSDENIEEIISKSINITAGWYANPSVAEMYSKLTDNKRINTVCEDDCVFSYKLKKDIILFLLDDDYNIAKLFQSNTNIVPNDQKNNLASMFNIKVPVGSDQPVLIKTNEDKPFKRLNYTKTRISDRKWDKPFADWICKNIIEKFNYSGYGATTQQTPIHGGVFHLEFIFCNAFKWLQRDLDNPKDWQYKKNIKVSNNISTFIKQLKLYETTNVNFHSGNLYEHSVWCLLNAEEFLKFPDLTLVDDYDFNLKKVIAFSAFIHDIGKMYPYNTNIVKFNSKRKKFVYFAVKRHPTYGMDYINGNQLLPIINEDGVKTEDLNIDDLFRDFGIDLNYKVIVSAILGMHWEFGNSLKKFNQDTNKVDSIADEYIKLATTFLPQNLEKKWFRFSIYGMLTVSLSDIMATLPHGVDDIKFNLTPYDNLNKSSYFFPYIQNVPKKYRGGNLAEISNLKVNGYYLGNYILKKIL